MKGDFSRDVFDAANHYSAVLLEQGGLITDSDWKEQTDLVRYRMEREAGDVIGACGGPLGAAAFELTAGLQPRAIEADAASPLNLWIATDDGYVLHSVDGGASWTASDTGSILNLHAVRFAGSRGWAVGERGTVFTSNDLGATWSAVDAGAATTLRGIALSGAQRVWLVGDGGVVLFSVDAGVHWTRRSPEHVQLNAVSFHGISNGIAVGDNGRILTTSNGGDTWHSRASGTTEDLLNVAFVDATNAWAVGSNGTIVHSADGGATWAPQSSGSAARLGSVSFSSSTAGVAAGSGGVLLRTTDSGVTWSAVASGSPQTIRSLAVVGGQVWYVADGALVHEVDLGTAVHTQNALPALSLSIGEGRYYVRGTLCEVEQPVSYYNQPDRGRPPRLASGIHLVFVQVWQRHLSALEAPSIREVALGQADPSARAKTVWQVKTLPLPPASPAVWNCLSGIPEWDDLAWPPGTRMSARAEPQAQPTNVCDIGASAGYRRLENQLYRVEVQEGGATPKFKWSRENGSVAFAVEDISASAGSPAETVVRLRSRGQDRNLDLAAGDWVELLDDDLALEQRVGPLLQFAHDGNDPTEVVLTGSVPAGFGHDPARHPLVRRWDQKPATGSVLAVTPGSWMDLEDGVQVRFEPGGQFRPGDYWEIPARTVTGDVEWPRNASGAPIAQAPEGIEDRFCRLGFIEVAPDGTIQLLSDCRNLFPPLTMLEQLVYVSGDGQDGMPGQVLPQPLIVRVVRGSVPIAGVTVRFSIDSGNGSIIESSGSALDKGTGSDGLAQCHWALDAEIAPASRHQRLSACLLDAAGNPLPGAEVVFAATGSLSLDLIGGDGQEAAAGTELGQAIEVRVANGQSPLAGAQINFTVVAGGGLITTPNPLPTSAQGIASAHWRLGTAGLQRVEARLHDSWGNLVQQVAFNAQIRPPATVGGCAITIGEGGHEKKLTSELLKKLLEEKRGFVCICFLPGEHDVEELMVDGNGGFLSIHGCGRASLVHGRDTWTFIEFGSIDISNIKLDVDPDKRLQMSNCKEVRLDNLSAVVQSALAGPFLRIGGFNRATLSHCHIEATGNQDLAPVSVVFEEGKGAIEIANSEIAGITSFYGLPETNKLPLPEPPFAQFRDRLNARDTSFVGGGGRVRLEGNRFDLLSIGKSMREQLTKFISGGSNTVTGLLSEAIVTDNSFAQPGGTFIANLLALSDCTFMDDRDPNATTAAIFAASRATVTANIGVILDDRFVLFVYTRKGNTLPAANSIFIMPPP